MADEPKPQQGDEAELFALYNDALMRRVARVVRTSPETIEDACSIAWAQFLRHQPDRDREWRAWLFKTAQREAWALDQARYGTRSFDAERDENSSAAEPLDSRDLYRDRDDLEAAVDVLQRLPPRLRRVAFLRATGHRYSEIQEITGDSRTRVSQLIRRATSRSARRSRSSTLTQRQRQLEQSDCASSSRHPQNGSAKRSDDHLGAEAAGTQTPRAC